jgi:hypothetical protein
MRKSILSVMAVLVICTACEKKEKTTTVVNNNDTTNVVKDETPADAAKPMDSAAMMKAWMDYATPGDMHKMLAAETGSWTTSSSMWMTPGAPPEQSTGSAEIKMAYGGRYQTSVHKGTVMGAPFEGTATVGYNNASKKFESTWMDNMGTGVMFMTGDYDAGNKVINFTGQCIDPMTGKEKTYREVYTIVDDNTRKMEMYDTDPSGKEFKSMEMTMKRK